MAFTERYVTDAAGGGGVGSEGDPWTLAEALTSAVAGDRVNILSDSGYSLGVDTISNAGTVFDLIVFRGYNSTIGDLQNPGRSSTTGKIDKTGFPAITLTGILTPNTHAIFQNLAFTGALSSQLISSAAIDEFAFIECEVINTQNNASASCVRLDNQCLAINSDFECTGASHGLMVRFDSFSLAASCRFKAVAGDAIQLSVGGTALNNLFIGNGSNVAFKTIGTRTPPTTAVGNTFYNWATAIEFPNTAPLSTPVIYNNHVTDCAKYIDDLYAATDLTPVIELNNRTRDNTTPRTGVGDGILSGEVTTDTGGAETDYTNAGADDLSLISGAPGVDTGLGFGT